ncbi:MAG: TerB family tellurite resistance protein [Bacteroidales bacterium]|nr:TerB family tellurite resistance protein [Bacteroidales bacterium]
METFTQQEKEMMFSILSILVKTDYRTSEVEVQLLDGFAKELEISNDFTPATIRQLRTTGFDMLAKMSKEKKRVFSRMMTETARADGHFGHSEQAFVTEVLDACEMPFIHR